MPSHCSQLEPREPAVGLAVVPLLGVDRHPLYGETVAAIVAMADRLDSQDPLPALTQPHTAFHAWGSTPGCKAVTAKVSLGAAGTPATYQIQLSDDGAAWVGVGTATAAIANQTVILTMPAGMTANFARVACTVAGATQTGNYVAINAVT